MTSTAAVLVFQQTASAAQEAELRLQRIKQEAALVEEHSDKLENRRENVVLKGESEISAAGPEVCDFIRVINVFVHSVCEKCCVGNLTVLLSVQHCPLVFRQHKTTAKLSLKLTCGEKCFILSKQFYLGNVLTFILLCKSSLL